MRLVGASLLSVSMTVAVVALSGCQAVTDAGPAGRGSATLSPGTPGPPAPTGSARPRPSRSTDPDPPSAPQPTGVAPAEAAARLAGLPVAARADRPAYRREAFGKGWGRIGGCETRDVVLARQLRDVVRVRGDRCAISSGTFQDPYTALARTYRRGQDPGKGLDVDHLVSLRNAWQSGAAGWDDARREAFANDLRNLQLTAAGVNRGKGDAPVDAWVPPNRGYRCTYAVRWIEVKAAWRLAVTTAERDTLTRLLRSCPRT